ncbi:MAG TPA: hypothetical protein VLG44_04980 [Chlamydiales bacterium]|nr:hypothetical protein [Chlamydiales bacterium]
MKRLFFIPLALTSLLFADDAEEVQSDKIKKNLAPSLSEGNMKSIMMIDPKDRAGDFIKAYETLRKEIAPNKIYFHIAKGSAINNVMDLSLMEHGTLLIFRVSTPQGPQYKIVPVEDVLDVSHTY